MFETLPFEEQSRIRLHSATIGADEFSGGIARTFSVGGPKQDMLSAYLDWFSSQQPVALCEHPAPPDPAMTCTAAVIPFPSVRATRGLPFG